MKNLSEHLRHVADLLDSGEVLVETDMKLKQPIDQVVSPEWMGTRILLALPPELAELSDGGVDGSELILSLSMTSEQKEMD